MSRLNREEKKRMQGRGARVAHLLFARTWNSLAVPSPQAVASIPSVLENEETETNMKTRSRVSSGAKWEELLC